MVVTYEWHDESRPRWDGDGPRPIRVYAWTTGLRSSPLVVLSHGTGGSPQDFAWLTEPLVDKGFTVVGVDHHGNNYVDGYLPEGFAYMWERPRDLAYVVERIARDGRIGVQAVDTARVGAVGFSAGGYTALALVGARIDPNVVRALVSGAVPMPPIPEFPELIARLRARHDEAELEEAIARSGRSYVSGNVVAAFAIAPGLGPMVSLQSLEQITAPVALRWGDADDICVPSQNALRYAGAIRDVDARSVGRDVGHYTFCGVEPDEAGEFRALPDTAGVLPGVAAEAAEFFTAHLTGRSAPH